MISDINVFGFRMCSLMWWQCQTGHVITADFNVFDIVYVGSATQFQCLVWFYIKTSFLAEFFVVSLRCKNLNLFEAAQNQKASYGIYIRLLRCKMCRSVVPTFCTYLCFYIAARSWVIHTFTKNSKTFNFINCYF